MVAKELERESFIFIGGPWNGRIVNVRSDLEYYCVTVEREEPVEEEDWENPRVDVDLSYVRYNRKKVINTAMHTSVDYFVMEGVHEDEVGYFLWENDLL